MLQMRRRKWLLLLLRGFTQQGLFLHRHICFDVDFLVGVKCYGVCAVYNQKIKFCGCRFMSGRLAGNVYRSILCKISLRCP